MNPLDVKSLLEVSNLRKEIKNRFTKKTLNNQGLEQDLSVVFKPITESQTKTTTSMISHLSNLSNSNNKQIIDFKDTFRNFPDLVNAIDEIKSLLDIKTTEIINRIKTREPQVTNEIGELNHEHEQFGDALSELMSEADTGVDTMLTDKSLGAISKIPVRTPVAVKKAREYVAKESAIRESLETEKRQSESTYRGVLDACESSDWKINLKNILKDSSHQADLIRYAELNPGIDLRTKPWTRIAALDSSFSEQIKQVKKSKTGKGLTGGVKFLPDNANDLTKELLRLIGSYKSGNKNVYNELNAVVDELRRKGILSIEQSKIIYKMVKG